MDKLVSIIIPTYNRASLIGETLKSISAQSYTHWECIIVDDHSTDDTTAVVNGYVNKDNRFRLFQVPKNSIKGPNACRNFGFEKSAGFYVYWFDSDDILLKEALAERIQQFDVTTDAVVAKADFFDSETGEILFTNTILSNNTIEDYFIGVITYYVSGPLWKKAFLNQQAQLFDESIRYLDDWDFNLRMLYKNPVINYIDKPLFKYRSHAHSLSKQIQYFNIDELKSEYKARNKHILLLEKTGSLTKNMQKYMLTRYKSVYRDLLVTKNESRFYFFKELIKLQLRFRKYGTALKTIFGFVVYSIFNRGYFLIK